MAKRQRAAAKNRSTKENLFWPSTEPCTQYFIVQQRGHCTQVMRKSDFSVVHGGKNLQTVERPSLTDLWWKLLATRLPCFILGVATENLPLKAQAWLHLGHLGLFFYQVTKNMWEKAICHRATALNLASGKDAVCTIDWVWEWSVLYIGQTQQRLKALRGPQNNQLGISHSVPWEYSPNTRLIMAQT